MFSISDLPRSDDGLVNREFIAKHATASFTLEAHDFYFVNGVTVEPISGRTCDRLCAAYGSDIVFVPHTREDGEATLAWMMQYRAPAQRVDRLSGELDALFPVAKPEPERPPAPAKLPSLAPAPRSYAPPADDLDTDQATPRAKGKNK